MNYFLRMQQETPALRQRSSSCVHYSRRLARTGMQFDWRATSGPALATATAVIAIVVDRNFIAVPNPAPLFVCIVAVAACLSGLASGMVAAAIAVAGSALFFFNHRATPG